MIDSTSCGLCLEESETSFSQAAPSFGGFELPINISTRMVNLLVITTRFGVTSNEKVPIDLPARVVSCELAAVNLVPQVPAKACGILT